MKRTFRVKLCKPERKGTIDMLVQASDAFKAVGMVHRATGTYDIEYIQVEISKVDMYLDEWDR